jgi:hypothetical protein
MSAICPKQTWASAPHMSAFGGKADIFLYRRSRCANADRCGGGSPSQRSAAVRVSAAMYWSRSWMSFKTSSGDTCCTLCSGGPMRLPRLGMVGKSTWIRF